MGVCFVGWLGFLCFCYVFGLFVCCWVFLLLFFLMLFVCFFEVEVVSKLKCKMKSHLFSPQRPCETPTVTVSPARSDVLLPELAPGSGGGSI